MFFLDGKGAMSTDYYIADYKNITITNNPRIELLIFRQNGTAS